MSTTFWNGMPGIICRTCNGTGQERYQRSSLSNEFNAYNGRWEGDLFIRRCIKCDGIGAFEDMTGARRHTGADQLTGPAMSFSELFGFR